MTPGLIQRSLYIIFALSGFSGLIYESVWSHYLKLLLGHAAYAQALVLVIFMGGMALGAWLVSRATHRIKNLLLAYALIEGIIGIFGLVFHPVYQLIFTISFDNVIPVLGSPLYVHIYKFTIASLLILPQSILLGATFPLMSGGFIRKFPGAPGQSISLLYFSNSLGAALALPISAFYLTGTLGLPGTIFTSGIINIVIAVLVYALAKEPQLPGHTGKDVLSRTRPSLFLAASFLTGMASFIYEVAWIRMLSMVLGSSTHSFELMLSAFITGLAIGGYWIRKRIDTLKDPIGFAATVQIVMGLFAFATIFLYEYSFEIMSFFMAALNHSDQGYILFSLASHSIALLIMLPATICAGMTLPLFTCILLKQNSGEKSIGLIYSSNTIGAIAGVIFTVFIGMPILDLKGSILTGAGIDIAVGVMLLGAYSSSVKFRYPVYSAALFLILFVCTAAFFEFNPKRMASGVFRSGQAELDAQSEILFHQDGRTASVTVSERAGQKVTIFTNGKPDAAITMRDDLPPTLDEATMVLLAAIPLSVYPEARTIANIGMGSGMTAHTALALPGIERVDTIEIEQAMVVGARYFISKTERVFNDPRSHIHIDDARTFFSTHQHQYDMIISEPSNPWVSGVSSLFTREFYRAVKKHVNKDGVFVQWVQIYEFNVDLLISLLKALSAEFTYYSIYFADKGNLILIASQDHAVDMPVRTIFDSEEMVRQLSGIYINNLQDLSFRFLGDQDLYNPYIKHFPIPANSDYYPILDLGAPKSMFLKEEVSDLLNLRLSQVPILNILYEDITGFNDMLTTNRYYPAMESADIAYRIYGMFSRDAATSEHLVYASSLKYLFDTVEKCESPDPLFWTESFYQLISNTVVYLRPDQIDEMAKAITPVCGSDILSDNQTDWLHLFGSLGHRNIPGIVDASNRLLNSQEKLTVQQKKFVSTSMLAGLISMKEYNQALMLWKQHMSDLFTEGGEIALEIQLLLALINPTE